MILFVVVMGSVCSLVLIVGMVLVLMLVIVLFLCRVRIVVKVGGVVLVKCGGSLVKWFGVVFLSMVFVVGFSSMLISGDWIENGVLCSG